MKLGSGTFYLTGTITLKNQVAVRGMGANSTFIEFYGQGSCNGLYSQFCEAGNYYVGGEQNHATWTANFSQGATSITLSNSLNITAGRTWVILDQQDEANDTGISELSRHALRWIQRRFCPHRRYLLRKRQSLCWLLLTRTIGFGHRLFAVLQQFRFYCADDFSWPIHEQLEESQYTGAWWASTTGYQMGVEDLSADLQHNGWNLDRCDEELLPMLDQRHSLY